MAETEWQKNIREAGEKVRENLAKGRVVKSDRIADAPGEDCPGCHGNAGPKPCPLCQI